MNLRRMKLNQGQVKALEEVVIVMEVILKKHIQVVVSEVKIVSMEKAQVKIQI